ncbi:cysteine-rich protein 2-binding protein [Bradysia coprophila]|uniref:cysteine-rich protein 2-binding protein n=1 Tax=Bradysia coprophila TaxID=38358 RepID=UPI00187D8F2B|nr:cysteine-rich protein 2-binding protein [Bradysia coprophila]
MDNQKECNYCHKVIDNDDYLNCNICKLYIHINCLNNSTPGDLLGDVFFEFVCSDCSPDGNESFERIALPWAILIVLAIHNLSIRSKGLGRQGFFHWRIHIACFIEKNWTALMGAAKRKKKWTGTISGALSHNTPILFTSGLETFQDSGWWKLTYNQSPKRYMELYQQLRTEKKSIEVVPRIVPSTSADAASVGSTQEPKRRRLDEEEVFSRSLPFMGRHPWNKPTSSEKSSRLIVDFLSSDSDQTIDFPDLNLDDSSVVSVPLAVNDWPDDFMNVEFPHEENDTDDNSEHKPRIVQVTNFQEAGENDVEFGYAAENIKNEIDTDTDEDIDDYSRKYVCEKSLFTQSVRRRLPWEVDGTTTADCVDQDEDIVPMSEYEENEMLGKLRNVIESDIMTVPPWVNQFYRKLCVRELKRGLIQPIFDIDHLTTGRGTNGSGQILDRYHLLVGTSGRKKTFYSTLAGSMEHEMFESPHTGRVLHPFIYRNSKSMPMWVKLMCELQYAVNGVLPSRASIDYCYVRPHHIAAVNSLLQNNFWPGIDMSECLSYPDFSIVALYKKLVIGCAFLVPDVGHCAAYVSFMAVRPGWQRAGVATFMLYHLTQTCMGKDITLHVSASNPAICLYQKFGFKIEEVILDFYEKYLPKDSKQSKHAFFLRLKR